MRIGSHSLGEFPMAVVCGRAGRAGSYRRDGVMAAVWDRHRPARSAFMPVLPLSAFPRLIP